MGRGPYGMSQEGSLGESRWAHSADYPDESYHGAVVPDAVAPGVVVLDEGGLGEGALDEAVLGSRNHVVPTDDVVDSSRRC